MKRYIYLFFMLMCIVSCEKPEEGVMPEKSVNANIVRFRIYQNQNLFLMERLMRKKILWY